MFRPSAPTKCSSGMKYNDSPSDFTEPFDFSISEKTLYERWTKIQNPGHLERVVACRHTVDLRICDDTTRHYGLLCIIVPTLHHDFL
jgi:hypothetical protein